MERHSEHTITDSRLYTGPDSQQPPMHIGRRALLRGLVGIGVFGTGLTLNACSSEEPLNLEPVPDCGETVVHIETKILDPAGMDLSSEQWCMPGVETVDNRLRVTPAPTTIVDRSERELKEKPENANDAPVLPFDVSRYFQSENGMQISGDFVLGQPETKAALLIAETLPLTYDEFQFLPGVGARLTISNAAGSLEIWDGRHKDPRKVEFALDMATVTNPTKSFTMTQEAGQLVIKVNGQSVVNPLDFNAKQIWLGLEAQSGSFDVKTLNVQPLPDKTATIADMRSLRVANCHDGLRSLAERKNPNCKIGTAVAVAPMLTNHKYAALLAGNFNMITTENALKPQFIQPQEGVFRTEEMQHILDFAERHNMQVHGHALLPNRSMPKWMRELPISRVRQAMTDHITGVIQRIPKLASIDVVNEPLEGWDWRKDTIWYRAMGDQFIDIALETAYDAARQFNPNLVLVINENSTDKDNPRDEARFNLLLPKLIDARKKGMNVAMGFEGHVQKLGRDEMSPNDLERRMAVLSDYGILARVSEMDVTTHIDDDTTDEGLRKQAEQFGSIAAVCMRASNCISFTMWGIGGKYVSTAGVDGEGELSWGSNLPWDKDLKQRPSTYRALQDALR